MHTGYIDTASLGSVLVYMHTGHMHVSVKEDKIAHLLPFTQLFSFAMNSKIPDVRL